MDGMKETNSSGRKEESRMSDALVLKMKGKTEEVETGQTGEQGSMNKSEYENWRCRSSMG